MTPDRMRHRGMERSTGRRLALLVLVGAALFSGCGGSDDDGSDGTSGPSTEARSACIEQVLGDEAGDPELTEVLEAADIDEGSLTERQAEALAAVASCVEEAESVEPGAEAPGGDESEPEGGEERSPEG